MPRPPRAPDSFACLRGKLRIVVIAIAALVGAVAACDTRATPLAAPLPDAAAASLPALTDLVGEVHLHQYGADAHAYALFVARPVPRSLATSGTLSDLAFAATLTDGPCTLYVAPRCAPACDTASYCSGPGTCTPLPPPQSLDGGEVDVSGSHYLPLIRLWFDPPSRGYVSDPPPGERRLFVGGETLSVGDGDGRGGPFAFTGSLTAPLPLTLTAPSENAHLKVPTSGPFPLTWVAGPGERIHITLNAASIADGNRYAWIKCLADDTGSLEVPERLLAGLPPPPRTTHLEVERSDDGIFATPRAGLGVLVHAAQTVFRTGED